MASRKKSNIGFSVLLITIISVGLSGQLMGQEKKERKALKELEKETRYDRTTFGHLYTRNGCNLIGSRRERDIKKFAGRSEESQGKIRHRNTSQKRRFLWRTRCWANPCCEVNEARANSGLSEGICQPKGIAPNYKVVGGLIRVCMNKEKIDQDEVERLEKAKNGEKGGVHRVTLEEQLYSLFIDIDGLKDKDDVQKSYENLIKKSNSRIKFIHGDDEVQTRIVLGDVNTKHCAIPIKNRFNFQSQVNSLRNYWVTPTIPRVIEVRIKNGSKNIKWVDEEIFPEIESYWSNKVDIESESVDRSVPLQESYRPQFKGPAAQSFIETKTIVSKQRASGASVQDVLVNPVRARVVARNIVTTGDSSVSEKEINERIENLGNDEIALIKFVSTVVEDCLRK